MKVHEQRDVLAKAIELALPELAGSPPLEAFGHARDDCALVHIDHFTGLQMAASVLVDALAQSKGLSRPEAYQEFVPEPNLTARTDDEYRAAYTKVKEWAA